VTVTLANGAEVDLFTDARGVARLVGVAEGDARLRAHLLER